MGGLRVRRDLAKSRVFRCSTEWSAGFKASGC